MDRAVQSAPTALDFMNALYKGTKPDEWLTLWRKKPEAGNRYSSTEWRRVSDRAELCSLAEQHYDKWDCYFSVCSGKPDTQTAGNKGKRLSNADIATVPAYFMDIDTLTDDKADKGLKDLPTSIADALEGLQLLDNPPSATIQSGRGVHAYWILAEPLAASPEATAALKHFATAVANATGWTDLDVIASEPARVLRVPNTLNHKSAVPQAVKLLTLDSSARYDTAELDAFAALYAPEQAPDAPILQLVEYLPELEDGAIIQRAMNQTKSGQEFTDLYTKGSAGMNPSSADYKLCRLIAEFTTDTTQIDRIFRGSKLMRDKWNNREDYRNSTIDRALAAVGSRRATVQPKRQNDQQQADEGEGDKRPHLTYEAFLEALQAARITIRFNQVTGEIEFNGLPQTFSQENAANTAPPYIRQELLAPAFKGADRKTVEELIERAADQYRYSPVIEWLQSLQWDGRDRLEWLHDSVLALDETDTLSRALIPKWFIQCIAMAHNGIYGQPYSADGVLTLLGAQGCGKTTFFKRLVPVSDWQVTGAQINMEIKDTLINALGAWIVELGEVDSTLKKEQSSLKAFITQERDNIRTPYAKVSVKRPRRTSFCASVNEEAYLRDPTGSRRWWTIPVTMIDWQELDKGDNREQLWAQIYELWKKEPQSFRINSAESRELEKRNGTYQALLPAEDEIRSGLDWQQPTQLWKWYSASELQQRLSIKASAEQIGRAIRAIKADYPDIEQKKISNVRKNRLPQTIFEREAREYNSNR